MSGVNLALTLDLLHLWTEVDVSESEFGAKTPMQLLLQCSQEETEHEALVPPEAEAACRCEHPAF